MYIKHKLYFIYTFFLDEKLLCPRLNVTKRRKEKVFHKKVSETIQRQQQHHTTLMKSYALFPLFIWNVCSHFSLSGYDVFFCSGIDVVVICAIKDFLNVAIIFQSHNLFVGDIFFCHFTKSAIFNRIRLLLLNLLKLFISIYILASNKQTLSQMVKCKLVLNWNKRTKYSCGEITEFNKSMHTGNYSNLAFSSFNNFPLTLIRFYWVYCH